MKKKHFIIGYSNLSDFQLSILLIKMSDLCIFKEINLKNLITSFIDVDVFVTGDKLTPTIKKFLGNICIPYFKVIEYGKNIELLTVDVNNSLRNNKNKTDEYNNALRLLSDAYVHGNLNYHELNHSIRVANESVCFGKKVGFVGEKLKNLFIASLLHDIGKAGIAKNILNKKSRLNDKEFEEIVAHPIIGANLVSRQIKEMVRCHHERYNGAGYPNHLKGEEICLESRIIGLVDSYDAMTTKRCYKEKYSISETLRELKMCSISEDKGGKGILYDPILIEKYIALKTGAK